MKPLKPSFIFTLCISCLLLACGAGNKGNDVTSSNDMDKKYRWTVVTTWQKNYPLLGTSIEKLADLVAEMSRGQLTMTVYGSGELVPALEVFDAVSSGAVQAGHSAAYYWRGKLPVAQFFTNLPFGMTAMERAAWLYYGGGLELWREIYGRHNLVPFPAGNTGSQWGGWFRKPINSVADLKGLKVRMPGFGGEVMKRLGAQQVLLPGAELYTALETGVIDAVEWVGPTNDLSYGFHEITRYYYYPGWQETAPTMELIVNKKAWEALPKHLQAIVSTAAQAIDLDMMAQYGARNPDALQTIEKNSNIQVLQFPDAVLTALARASEEAIQEQVARDPDSARVYRSWQVFKEKSKHYRKKADAFLEARQQ